MSHSSRKHDYLESKILTAPPHRLHLMLIEGALRFGRQAEEALRRGDLAAADEPLMRTFDLVGEMLAGVRGENSELNRQIADFYLFLFRRVAGAKIHGDVDMLAEALRLLEFERETWQLVCAQVGDATPAEEPPTTYDAQQYPSTQPPLIQPDATYRGGSSEPGISFQA